MAIALRAFCALCFSTLVEGVLLAPEPLTFEVAKDREQEEHQVEDANRQIDALEDRRAEATVEDLAMATRTVKTQAEASAEEAQGAERHVEEMEMQQKALLAKAKDYSAQQEAQVKYAEESNKEMEKELEKAKAFAKTADASAKDLAKQAVQQMFLAKNKELQDWRDEVLTDHWALGQREAAKAAAPYQHAMGVALEKANSYKSTAQTLSTVAKGLAEEANRATLTAGEKRLAGDSEGALRLSEAAGALRKHGRELRSYAKDLQQESAHLSEAAPSYLSSGQQAAARAEWEANPQALPPMTVDPSVAYIPA